MSDYKTIVVDPPWKYGSTNTFQLREGLEKQRVEKHEYASETQYGAMTLDDLEALPVQSAAADNAHLYLWTTNSFMAEAHTLAKAWGFDVKTILTYGKVKADGTPSMKMGYYYRGATEHVLFCVRGRMRLKETAPALPTLMLLPRLPHSVKPDEFYEMVELASPGPYLELFARRRREGWHHWGDEVECDVQLVEE